MTAADGIAWVGVVAAIVYLALAIRESRACWWFGGTSSALYAYLTWDAGLIMQAALNVFYVAMAVYGWRQWARNDEGHARPVARWRWPTHAIACGVIAVFGVGTAAFVTVTEQTSLALGDAIADATITYAAVWTTYLVARKELGNWSYWFVIDVATIVLLVRQDLATAAIPYVLYLFMIPFGYSAWRRSYDGQAVAA